MKRKITLLLSLILILTVGFTVSAEEQEENISMPLKKYSYSGSKANWVNRENGICLSLAHTGWAYTGCPTGLITWSWNTVVNKFSSSSHWTNEQGMAEQYQCHVNFATTKNPWNLEPWRPAVGVFETIEKKCNP